MGVESSPTDRQRGFLIPCSKVVCKPIAVTTGTKTDAMNEVPLDMFLRLGVALAIGAFVGLQRETTDSRLAGVRTFALAGLAGTLTALVGKATGSQGWFVASGLFAMTAMIVVSRFRLPEQDSDHVGMTTAVALLIVFLTGVYLLEGSLVIAAAVSVSVTGILQLKPELHSIAGRLADTDIHAILQFAVFSCIVLPILPNSQMGPLNVFNPFNIWLMVVLIVGISLAGYIAFKFFGQSAGALVGGLLGGAISSTATSLSYGRKARQLPSMTMLATTVIVIASSVVFVRVLIELAVVAPNNFKPMATPMAIMLGSCVVAAVISWSMFRGQNEAVSQPSNPTELKSALLFAGLYALVLWGLAATRQYLNDDALYVVAALSGLTDMDAITLSTGRMVEQGSQFVDGQANANQFGSGIGARLLLTAAIANLIFKAGVVAFVGGWRLFVRVAGLFLIPIATGALLIWFW